MNRRLQRELLIDCFLGFRELSLANFRITYLRPEVEYVIIGESDITHSGKAKPLYFSEWKQRHPDLFSNVEVILIDLSFCSNAWEREVKSREQLIKFAAEKYPDAQFVLSDLDEIPSISQLQKFKSQKGIYHFVSPTSYRYTNWELVDSHTKWNKGVLGDSNLAQLPNGGRMSKFPNIASEIKGIHVSYLRLHNDFIASKMSGFAHEELNNEVFFHEMTIDYADRYQIDHLGRFNRKGMGLLRMLRIDQLSPIQKELLKFEKKWFSFEICNEPIYRRLFASLVIYSIIECNLHRDAIFQVLIKGEKSHKKEICIIGMCLLRNLIGATWYRIKHFLKELSVANF